MRRDEPILCTSPNNVQEDSTTLFRLRFLFKADLLVISEFEVNATHEQHMLWDTKPRIVAAKHPTGEWGKATHDLQSRIRKVSTGGDRLFLLRTLTRGRR